jgi:hypothetical protein
LQSSSSMSDSLKDLWLDGRHGTLNAFETLKAYCYWKVYLEMGVSEKKVFIKVAEKVTKVGGGHPGNDAVGKAIRKIKADPEWFPGKLYGESPGRDKALSGQARHCLKRSAEAMKQAGEEPTYPLLVARNPKAVRNPETGEPVDKKVVYEVLRTECFDTGAELPWKHEHRLQKSSLPVEVCEKRLAWGFHMRDEVSKTEAWYYRHVVWTDFCNSILPLTQKKATEQALARKGKKGWQSPDCKEYSRNLAGKRSALTQASWGTQKVWWIPVLTRGKLHTELLPANFEGEHPPAIFAFLAKVPAILNVRFPNDNKPRVMMTDRGPAFYHASTGKITPEYKAALSQYGLRAMMGDDASQQSGDSQEVMLHETAVAWLRDRLKLSLPPSPWLETREMYGERLKRCTQWVNDNYDVEGLCRGFPSRLDALIEKKGDRLRK